MQKERSFTPDPNIPNYKREPFATYSGKKVVWKKDIHLAKL